MIGNGKKMDLKRGIYVLPSLLTAGNMSLGFISMINSVHYNFTMAAWCVIGAIVFDATDGRVARWTRSTSNFGVEFDSLADLVSFGLAPSFMMYQMMLQTMGKPGIAIALFFVLSGALRLARYNVKAHEGEFSSDFAGLPIPAAAGILASFVLSYELFATSGPLTVKTIPVIMQQMPMFFKLIPPTMIIIALLMVSTIPYAGFKKMKWSRPKSLQVLVFLTASILLVVTYPQNTIFAIFLLYIISGLISYVWRYWRLRSAVGRALTHKELLAVMNGKKSIDDLKGGQTEKTNEK
jgi:CDP-diacylglycerol---serine O-phosphatidyltransferase